MDWIRAKDLPEMKKQSNGPLLWGTEDKANL